jgi:hypothetical protein
LGVYILGKWDKKHKHRKHRTPSFSIKEWLDMAMCMTYVKISCTVSS